jgi:hypothetical protein
MTETSNTPPTTPEAPAPAAPAVPPEGAAAPAAGAPAAPAEITYDLKFPEALAPGQELVSEFTKAFQAHKLAPEAAQAIVDVLPKGLEAAQSVFQQTLERQHADQVKAWEDAVRADPTMGGAKLDATLAAAQSALGRFGDDDLRALLESTGFGSHPAVIRLFAKLNQEISEGKHVPGGQPAPVKSAAEALYTHPTSRKSLKFG